MTYRSPPREPRPARRSRRKTRLKSPSNAGPVLARRARRDPSTGELRVIGPYRVLRVLGEGGMGTVYLAEQLELGRRVAVKIIRSALVDRDAARRFASERIALARMHHPYIAQVFDAGATEEGHPYIAMEHIPGLPISRHCENKKPSLGELLRLFITVAQALFHAHEKGTIHRDVKPSNILVMEVDGRAIPKVIDFGIAKLADRSTPVTEAGAVVGTVAYMSPEQIRGGTVDLRTDVYSFGVLLYELLTGQLPNVVRREDESLWEDHPAELERIVNRCLEADPEDRYESFGGIVEELGALLDELRSSDRGDGAAALERYEELGERLMGELWALFETAAELELSALLQLFERAADSPSVLRALILEARRLEERRRKTVAVESRLVEASADCRLAFALPARHRSRKGLLERAVQGLRRALDDAPAPDAEASCRLGDACFALGQLDEAAEAYRAATELDRGLGQAFYGLAAVSLRLLLGKEGDEQQAQKALEEGLAAARRAAELAADSSRAHNVLGMAHFLSHYRPEISSFGSDKLREAILAYRRAIDLDSGFADAYRNLGLAYHQKGEHQSAVEAFWRAIDLSQGSESARVLKALLADPSAELLASAIAEERLVPEGAVPCVLEERGAVDTAEGGKLARRGKIDLARAAFLRSEKRRREEHRS